MPRLTKIYTRTGDDGSTTLGNRKRLPKSSLRVSAYGDVDELNSLLGVILSGDVSQHLRDILHGIQYELFVLGSDLSFPETEENSFQVPRIEEQHVTSLERLIDGLLEDVGDLQNFILPGGTREAAYLHLARTICRRAERTVVDLANTSSVSGEILSYLNRLSDAFFVLARFENVSNGVSEPLWDSRK